MDKPIPEAVHQALRDAVRILMVQGRDGLLLANKLNSYASAIYSALTAAQQPEVDQFIATFRCEDNGIVGTTDAKIHSVTRHDDGRIEVVIDHWPKQPAETSITRRDQELIAAAATHCDNCGCSWLDNGLNPVGCPYCKQRELLTLAEQWERDAAGCRRDGYLDAAVVKEDCAQRIRQTLGISAIAKALSQPPAAADDEEKRDVWRTLWLVLRQTGTVVVPPHDIVSTDWSKCQIEQTVHQLTGAVQLHATILTTQQQGGSDNGH